MVLRAKYKSFLAYDRVDDGERRRDRPLLDDESGEAVLISLSELMDEGVSTNRSRLTLCPRSLPVQCRSKWPIMGNEKQIPSIPWMEFT